MTSEAIHPRAEAPESRTDQKKNATRAQQYNTMDKLYDYIQWLGDYTFAAVPFQEVDAVILCLLSYCDFTPLFERSDEALLRDCQRMLDAGEVRIRRVGKTEPFIQILQAAVSSRRFGDLRMSGFVDIMLPEEAIQFAAVTFHSDAGWSFIAYRGTDSTLTGWKEDFMISFKRTQAQELAKQYAENRIDADRAWYLGGHSKGGNLALYAACMLPEALRASVGQLFLLDGPGFCPEVLDPAAVTRVQSKATRIIPRYSIIGKLFEPQIKKTRIVQSIASGFHQHDLTTWGIDHGKLAEAKEADPQSEMISTILGKWIANTKREDREIFVNDMFDALGKGGAETLENLWEQGPKGYEVMTARLKDASDITKRILKDLSRQAIQAIGDALFRRAGD